MLKVTILMYVAGSNWCTKEGLLRLLYNNIVAKLSSHGRWGMGQGLPALYQLLNHLCWQLPNLPASHLQSPKPRSCVYIFFGATSQMSSVLMCHACKFCLSSSFPGAWMHVFSNGIFCFQFLLAEEIEFQYIPVLAFQGMSIMKLDSNGCCISHFCFVSPVV